MKPHRTPLLEDAVSGSVRAPVHGAMPSAALRERLSQTRARIERTHTTTPPQIDIDWDPDEPPTRVYQGEPLRLRLPTSAVRSEAQANPLTAYALAQFRARVSQRPARAHAPPTRTHAPQATAPVTPRDLSVTQRATAQLPPPEPAADHIVALQEHQTLPPFASRMLREVSVLRERLGELYHGLDRSDAALRRRVAYCSLALLVVAAGSRMLFGGHSDTTVPVAEQQQQPAVRPAPVPRHADVAISSDPEGAQIFLNGRASSQVTPAKLTDLAPGRHMIGLKLAGYAEAKESLQVPGDALVSIKLAALNEPRFAPEQSEERTLTRAEQRAQARELARERRAAARAAKVLLRYRARMGLPPDPVAQELVEAYGPTQSAE